MGRGKRRAKQQEKGQDKGGAPSAEGGVEKKKAQQAAKQQEQQAPWEKNKTGEPALLPRKKMYRARAHSNPLSDQIMDVPKNPESVDWAPLYPSFFPQQQQQQPSNSAPGQQAGTEPGASTSGRSQGELPKVRFADIGCGFGGLLIRLSPLYPDTLMVGMELRLKVSEYVRERIASLRLEHPGQYGNISCIRTNAMKYLPNYFEKGQLTKMFFLFPDPHFKAANHRRRIINTTLVTEYAYLLAPGGWLYTITDVEELGNWMRDRLDAHAMFERVSEEELEKDPAANLLCEATEEGQKVARNKGNTYRAVYRRLPAPRELEHNPERLASRK